MVIKKRGRTFTVHMGSIKKSSKKNNTFIKRDSILESIDFKKSRNLFCEKKDLTNEASVELFFINRLLTDLGYKDKNIKAKESIDKFTVAKGSKKISYKPDYIIYDRKRPLLVIDAKAPNENISDWIDQCAHYCLILNRSNKTVKYFLLSNGFETALYKWDEGSPTLKLKFEDFNLGGHSYESLRNHLLIDNLHSLTESTDTSQKTITLKKINKEEAQKIFKACHKYIWNTEKRGVNSAFIEFVKLIFLKLWNDRKLHAEYYTDKDGELTVPEEANTFSEKWIKSREGDMLNPINDIQFKDLMSNLQDEVYKKNKKQIFDENEMIDLKPTTIKGVVRKLETSDLFGIDEDLNGRLFETFLNATMRGSSLGQYFTPRSIVLLGTLIADLQINEQHIDKVLDGSCGTGGFLIEALTIMRDKVRQNDSCSNERKIDIIKELSNDCLFGIDAAKDPKLARIARINMYLHGDGGSHIYLGDGLEKILEVDKSDTKEFQYETTEMAKHFLPNMFDVVLTNPPFSMWYESSDEAQGKVLEKYDLTKYEGTGETRNRLRGSAMFIERYYDLLKPGGKLISVIDDTILSSPQYKYVRDFIKERFIIRAIISLHGDAFQQSNARVKTAMLYLKKRDVNLKETQPAIFMYSSVYLGVDDMPITTKPSKVAEARKLANQEIKDILIEFDKFNKGKKGEWFVTPERIENRMDVKYCIPLKGRFVNNWVEAGFEVKQLKDICEPRVESIEPKTDFPDEEFRILTITYAGRCRADEIRIGSEINYRTMLVVRTGDIVFSEYNTFHGAIGYITDELDGCLASGSYIVVRCNNIEDSLYLWSILRTTEIRAEFLTSAVGMGRQTIAWEDIKTVSVPFLSKKRRQDISKQITDAWKTEIAANKSIDSVSDILHQEFNVESKESILRFLGAKPPR